MFGSDLDKPSRSDNRRSARGELFAPHDAVQPADELRL
jgi:hypothetical protein